MTADELLDAHELRLRNDPGYRAIWQRVQGIDRPELRMLALANEWAEQADGLRAIAKAATSEPDGAGAVRNQTTILITELLAWCVDQFRGESGVGESYWEQFREYGAACKIVEAARRAGIIEGRAKG